VVRVPYNRPELIRRALDSGADGAQVPLVNTAEDGRAAARAATFPPQGDRGAAICTRAAGYGTEAERTTYFARADAARLLVVHVETVEAVQNLDAIIEIDGIDVVFVGPGDLAVSMGYAREPNHPAVRAEIERCIRAIHAGGKIAGTVALDPERALEIIGWGATYIVTALQPFVIRGVGSFLATVRSAGEARR